MSYRLQQSLSERRCVTRNTSSKRSETASPFSFSTTIYRYAETDCDFVDRRRRLTTHLEGVRYYGYRFYNPDLGRWISRDPIGEEGGMHLYCFNNNDIVNAIDIIGLKCVRVVKRTWTMGCTRKKMSYKDIYSPKEVPISDFHIPGQWGDFEPGEPQINACEVLFTINAKFGWILFKGRLINHLWRHSHAAQVYDWSAS